jgi:hypothetical protein
LEQVGKVNIKIKINNFRMLSILIFFEALYLLLRLYNLSVGIFVSIFVNGNASIATTDK